MATTRLAIESRLPPGLTCAASRDSVEVPEAEARAAEPVDDSEATELEVSVEVDVSVDEVELRDERSQCESLAGCQGARVSPGARRGCACGS